MLELQPEEKQPEWWDFDKVSKASFDTGDHSGADFRVQKYGNDRWSWKMELWVNSPGGYDTREQAKAGVIEALKQMGFSDMGGGAQR